MEDLQRAQSGEVPVVRHHRVGVYGDGAGGLYRIREFQSRMGAQARCPAEGSGQSVTHATLFRCTR